MPRLVFTYNVYASMSINVKRKPGRPATGTDPLVATRMPPEMTAALDAAAAAEPDKPSRSELIRRIVTEWLKAKGMLR